MLCKTVNSSLEVVFQPTLTHRFLRRDLGHLLFNFNYFVCPHRIALRRHVTQSTDSAEQREGGRGRGRVADPTAGPVPGGALINHTDRSA